MLWRLYIRKKDGARGLVSVVESVEFDTINIATNVDDSGERLIKYPRNATGNRESKDPKHNKKRIKDVNLTVNWWVCTAKTQTYLQELGIVRHGIFVGKDPQEEDYKVGSRSIRPVTEDKFD